MKTVAELLASYLTAEAFVAAGILAVVCVLGAAAEERRQHAVHLEQWQSRHAAIVERMEARRAD